MCEKEAMYGWEGHIEDEAKGMKEELENFQWGKFEKIEAMGC